VMSNHHRAGEYRARVAKPQAVFQLLNGGDSDTGW
jgi:hypothetical protein